MASSTRSGQCPEAPWPEYAFVGRSNVGKSSLINCLMGQKSLAKTSSTPGKTQLINHFLVDERWFLVDLPGYGYARTSKSQRACFGAMIEDYILNRHKLNCLFVLVDARHALQKPDEAFMRWLGERGVPFAVVFTKTDKLKQRALEKNIAHYKAQMLEHWECMPNFFLTSAAKKVGGETLLSYIEALNGSTSL